MVGGSSQLWLGRQGALVCIPVVSFIFLLFAYLRPETLLGEVHAARIRGGADSQNSQKRLPAYWRSCSNESELLARQVADLKPFPARFVQFSFSEAVGSTVDKCVSDIGARVALGRTRALGMKVLIGGMARDIGTGMPNALKVFADLAHPFLEYRAVIFESDSQDNSRKQLLKWQQKDPDHRFVSAFFHDIWETVPVYTEHEGQIASGADLKTETMTVEAAKKKCASWVVCRGFTFEGTDDGKNMSILFKQFNEFATNPIPGWTSYHDGGFVWNHANYSSWIREGKARPRMARMASMRNKLRDAMLNVTAWCNDTDGLGCPAFEPDIVIVLDLDLGLSCIEPVDVDMVHAVIGRPEYMDGKIDMVCAQGLRRHPELGTLGFYDTFPLRHPEHESVSGVARPVNLDPATQSNPNINQEIFQGTPLRKVHSCFGGLAIYRPAALKECDYDEDGFDSEHVSFHKCMRAKGMTGIYLDPLMVTRGDSAHGPDSLAMCRICPTKEQVLETPLKERWGQWDWGANPGRGCDLTGCGAENDEDPNNRVPCSVKGQPATRCTCVNLMDGGETDEGCDCLPELDL